VERWEKIVRSRYNIWYKSIKGEGVPGYLKKGWREKRWQRVAKFRLGDEMRGGRYWEKEEKRICRICENEEETWKHVWEGCKMWETEGNWDEMMGVVLGEREVEVLN